MSVCVSLLTNLELHATQQPISGTKDCGITQSISMKLFGKASSEKGNIDGTKVTNTHCTTLYFMHCIAIGLVPTTVYGPYHPHLDLMHNAFIHY